MLLACKLCGAQAIEQIRGAIGPEEKGYVQPSSPGQETSNSAMNAADTRVICCNPEFIVVDNEKIWSCLNSTGWNKQDFADYTRFVWNRDHASQS